MSARTDEPNLSRSVVSGPWCLIESDPGDYDGYKVLSTIDFGVFTELLGGLGVRGAQVEEVWWSIEETSEWEKFGDVYGLIFLFKMKKDLRLNIDIDDDEDWKEVIENACATLALLNIVLNREELDLSEELQQFKEFTSDFASPLRGLAITNHAPFRDVHNSFARFDAIYPLFAKETAKAKKKKMSEEPEEAYHYVGFVPVNGYVWEIDGLARAPIKLGECTLDNWLEVARASVEEKMREFAEENAQFNLMAVVKDQVLEHEEKMKAQIFLKGVVEKQLDEIDKEWAKSDNIQQIEFISLNEEELRETEVRTQVTEEVKKIMKLKTASEFLSLRSSIISRIEQEKSAVVNEREKQEQYRLDNVRRRHNYIPFIKEFVTILRERGELEDLVIDTMGPDIVKFLDDVDGLAEDSGGETMDTDKVNNIAEDDGDVIMVEKIANET
ncbi:5045_t:CDS:10 [Paraglomus brasilianum]|uniref:ubiquitinyl hydrolase 1 n=1 Tax=Paraglomus brasilianum TaxID=144538 RepID=A0A9N9BIQ1_9GLOM|nr:5045_t:CDS:10 [Paraglomus brasilianum]